MAQRTANELLLDALVRHQTYLLRYSGYVRNRIRGLLDKSEEDIAALIARRLAAGTGLNTPADVKRLNALLEAIDKLRLGVWSDATTWLEDQMVDLAYQEPIAIANMISTVSPVVVTTTLPAPALLKAIALSRPFEGRLLRDWADTLASEDLRRIHAAIQVGMVAGESTDAITRRVMGTTVLKGTDGVTELTRRQVQAITRTAVQHVANSARDETMRANADIILAEQFVATLDSRTTPVCRANDGKQFPVGKGPRPPLHIACRSLRVAVLDGEQLGERPAKASTTKQLLREFTEANKLPKVTSRDDLPRGTKGQYDAFARKRVRELTGRVPSVTSYQQWLQQQSRQFQEDTLGVTRAKLFRDGGLTLDKFVAADGSELTLAQLAVKQADAFRAAGLDPTDF
jgi:SPP1 gp7 family putative phage head morphogenesis protein